MSQPRVVQQWTGTTKKNMQENFVIVHAFGFAFAEVLELVEEMLFTASEGVNAGLLLWVMFVISVARSTTTLKFGGVREVQGVYVLSVYVLTDVALFVVFNNQVDDAVIQTSIQVLFILQLAFRGTGAIFGFFGRLFASMWGCGPRCMCALCRCMCRCSCEKGEPGYKQEEVDARKALPTQCCTCFCFCQLFTTLLIYSIIQFGIVVSLSVYLGMDGTRWEGLREDSRLQTTGVEMMFVLASWLGGLFAGDVQLWWAVNLYSQPDAYLRFVSQQLQLWLDLDAVQEAALSRQREQQSEDFAPKLQITREDVLQAVVQTTNGMNVIEYQWFVRGSWLAIPYLYFVVPLVVLALGVRELHFWDELPPYDRAVLLIFACCGATLLVTYFVFGGTGLRFLRLMRHISAARKASHAQVATTVQSFPSDQQQHQRQHNYPFRQLQLAGSGAAPEPYPGQIDLYSYQADPDFRGHGVAQHHGDVQCHGYNQHYGDGQHYASCGQYIDGQPRPGGYPEVAPAQEPPPQQQGTHGPQDDRASIL